MPPDHATTATGLLARLVSFDTTSHKSNLDFIAFVESYLTSLGVASVRVADERAGKASLYATIGPQDRGGVALSGHSDVVPVDGQTWDSDPFTLREADGKLHARGSADMKGFIACALAAVPDLKKRQLKTPIHIAISYDEEIGCLGVRPMIAEFGKAGLPKPRFVVVGEPTSMRVVDAHKGPVRWRVDVHGHAAHSSMPHLGVNAIAYAARLIGELNHIAADLSNSKTDARFTPPNSTLEVTTIAGGTAANIIPIACRFGFEVRALAGVNIDAIEQKLRDFSDSKCLPEMQSRFPDAGITIERGNAVPPFAANPQSELTALALAWSEQNQTHAVSYATEAGLFQDAGSPAIVCGPGDIAQAHTANEWIAESELAKCSRFLGRLADWAET